VLVDHYRPLFVGAGLCQDLKEVEQEGRTVALGDPMEIALLALARQALPTTPAPRRLDEIPFDADRMRLSTVHDLGVEVAHLLRPDLRVTGEVRHVDGGFHVLA
jgi:magnesium-transporting ATPase (P-type)